MAYQNARIMNDLLYATVFGKSHQIIDQMVSEHRNDEVADLCIRRAYRDFNRTLRFDKDGTKAEVEKRKEIFYESAASKVRVCCLELFSARSKTEYDKIHDDACVGLEKWCSFDDGGDSLVVVDEKKWPHKFCYGQSQKWINMSMKYMYLMGYWNSENDIKAFMHLPVDSYILSATAGEPNEFHLEGNIQVFMAHIYDAPIEERKTGPYRESGKCKSQPWSRWDRCDYLNFLSQLRNKIAAGTSLFEWEADAWQKIASKAEKDNLG